MTMRLESLANALRKYVATGRLALGRASVADSPMRTQDVASNHRAALRLSVIGLDHRTAPRALRGRFIFTLEQLAPVLQGLDGQTHLHPQMHPQAALLSTGNRTELYCAGPRDLSAPAIRWLAARAGINANDLLTHAYVHHGAAAARHAFRVAAGLDSIGLGETRVVSRMKRALREAEAAGTLGSALNQLFQRAFAAAKVVRTKTAVGRRSISLGAACARLAQDRFGDLGGCKVLLVGEGETIESVAAHLATHAPLLLAIASRSPENAQQLATRFGAHSMAWWDMPSRLRDFDIVVSCTGGAAPVFTLGTVSNALPPPQRRRMLLIDLAESRDFAPEVACLADAELVSMAALLRRMQGTWERRRSGVAIAETIIDAHVGAFAHAWAPE